MQVVQYQSTDDLASRLRARINEPKHALLRSAIQVDPLEDFAQSVVQGLEQDPPQLESRFLYDAAGSEIYGRITLLPEYYPARTETAILRSHVSRIRELTGSANLLELGSGYSVKTAQLFEAYTRSGRDLIYLPIDVSGSALRTAIESIDQRHPGVKVIGVNATYSHAFEILHVATPVMGLFLGGSIGNLDKDEVNGLWTGISRGLAPGDHFLLGVDLHKDKAILEPAYNDAAGVSEEFTRNLFTRMNRDLGASVDPQQVRHIAYYNEGRRQMEIYAEFSAPQTLRVESLDRQFSYAAGDRILTEVSRKFRLADLLPYLDGFGMTCSEVFTDEKGWFALVLLRRRAGDGIAEN